MTSPMNSCHRGCAMDGRAEGGNGRRRFLIVGRATGRKLGKRGEKKIGEILVNVGNIQE